MMAVLSRIVFTAFDRSPSRTLLCLILTIGHLCVSAAPCTVCRDGSAVTLPEKKVQISALYPEMQCSSLDSLIPNLFPDESSEECGLIHQFSTLCGCPIPENACTLCPDGLAVGAPDAVLNENYAALIPDPDLPPTCDLVQSYLHSVSKQDDLCVFSSMMRSQVVAAQTRPPITTKQALASPTFSMETQRPSNPSAWDRCLAPSLRRNWRHCTKSQELLL